jgi:hypothetical protein
LTTTLPTFIRSCRDLDEFWGFIKPKFSTYAERRDYLRQEFDPTLSMLEAESVAPADSIVSAALSIVGSEYVQEAWQKALERRGNDPEGAITAARTLLETVCKHILDESGVTYTDTEDLPKLYSVAANQMNLSPNQHTEQVFKQILGNCQVIVGGLASLRNRLGDAHGKGKAGVKPSPRHAEFAVNLAGTMATFLIETLEARQSKAEQQASSASNKPG